MNRLFSAIVILLTLALVPVYLNAAEPVQHDLRIILYPGEHRFTAKDMVTVPGDLLSELRFRLHHGLNPTTPTPGVRLVKETARSGPVPLESFKVTLPAGQNRFILEYGGSIHHPLEAYGKEQARGFQRTPGMIFGEGVYLAGSTFWYPNFHEGLVTFTLQVQLPPGWDAVSQGVRTLHDRKGDKTLVRWESPEPQEEIYIVAAAFTEYSKAAGGVDAMVFLRTPDEELAGKYLDATVRYLALYEELIGPYPYKKFALVENFWETGFGMASFTLLGPKIIRFPFILHSSYPHEILHNWWGNGVFPNYRKGNWAEGLTAYLSDHLIKEMRGNGVAYRQQTLQKYTDYVLKGRDFPLSQFHSRHSSSSEAVGYGKSLMFFHMLRQQVGDRTFVQALQDFYQKNIFQFASFDDLRQSFEKVSGEEMNVYFNQWLTRTGAPELKVSRAESRADGDGFVLTAVLEQTQPGGVYPLRIPVAVTMEGQDRAWQTAISMEKNRLELKLRLPARPLRLDVDPEFDLFRRLDRDEIPPALTQTFGAKKVLILLPSSSGKSLLHAYRELSQSLAHSGPDEVEVKLDTEVKLLPSDRAVILLGWQNHFLSEMASALSAYDVAIKQNEIYIGPREIRRENHSVVLTSRLPENKDLSLTWVAADLPEALPGLGRKLPHYHKYSYLGFQGPEPTNIAKGRWPALDTPMTTFVAREDGETRRVERAKLTRREPLASLPVVFSKKRMLETVRFLSSEELRGRGLGTEELDRAAQFIAGKFQEAGLKPAGNSKGGYFQIWEDQSESPERRASLRNVVGVIPGRNPEGRAQLLVVGAHYDHLGLGWPDVREEHRGKIHHGADDNASGVAVLLELARVLGKSLKPNSTVVFVAFTGEEAGRKGSKYFVANQKPFSSEQTLGMLNLDTVGRLEDKKLLVLGAGSAREWIHIFRGAGYVAGVGVETVSKELDSSDQKSFQEAGVPAVQLFTGPHLDYHRPTDIVDKIDPDGLLKVASVAKEVIEYLAKREEPLTNTLKPDSHVESAVKKTRKVSLGIIPDFAYGGEGCRLSGVVPGSPAESSGLREGDVIVRIGSDAVLNLRDLSNILKSLNPGDRISITFLRADKEMKSEAEVVVR
ncbi:MAG: M20/M25/M40 family metallo-hydrolase [Deltaproteobacteria bacterium]|nr:MAG: M20/M25/M40 family metallo-hydrolase [Deltaproteobacteria bacterium]